MKKLLLILSLMVIGLSGCYVTPHRDHDDGYRKDRDHHEDGDRKGDRDDHEGDRRGDNDRDGHH